jgi:dTDP-4-dehydrorhamnose 3,5-epimerase-like enzyme
MQVETHVVEFSINLDKESVKRLAVKMGLTVDPNYSMSNGGVTRGLKFTGPRETLKKLVRRIGYSGHNSKLED